jgi:C-terminal processing protease CtpA/Prc
MKKQFLFIAFVFLFAILLSACQQSTPTSSAEQSPVVLKGDFSYSNDFAVETYYTEQAVALNDMQGFVRRDKLWELPLDGQVLGYLKIDRDNNKGEYDIKLPVKPQGTFNDVDNNGKEDKGVQIYSVAYSPNLTGGPFSEGDDRSFGWPAYLASVKIDAENEDEVTGGKLVIWAPDDKQQFPSAFGEDGLLFTKDDPVMSVPAGWSIIDLDQKPFEVIRQEMPNLTLYEPQDVAIKDFSNLSYTEAFQNMFDQVKKEYAFNGIIGKAPDWDAVYAQVFPLVTKAEMNKDATAYYNALREFITAFKDGHVGMDGGDIANQVFSESVAGGYGISIRELDDGRVIAASIVTGGPAGQAGIKIGDEITKFNGKPIKEALREVKPFSAPHSTDFSLFYQQDRYLTRGPLGTKAVITYIDQVSKKEQRAELAVVDETQSWSDTSVYKGYDPNALPVVSQIVQSDLGSVGVIKINSNYDDLNLIIRLFERALKTFRDNNVAGVIIDMRQNSGGANLGLAGFLTDKEIQMGQLEYFSDKTGKFEPEGPRERVLPNAEQYTFPKMTLLVGQGCASACELEAYGFSQVPGMQVIGMYPSSGTEAEVARGQFKLPENFTAQFPTGRFTNEDGSLFLEGQGVIPNIKVPIDEANVTSSEDVEMNRAMQYILQPEGAGVTPSGDPIFDNITEVQKIFNEGKVGYLEQYASEQYPNSLEVGNTFPYTIVLKQSAPMVWGFSWCTTSESSLKQNMGQISIRFTLNGNEVPGEKVVNVDQTVKDANGQDLWCRSNALVPDKWPSGEHHLETEITFKSKINDGTQDYPAGTIKNEYTVFVP